MKRKKIRERKTIKKPRRKYGITSVRCADQASSTPPQKLGPSNLLQNVSHNDGLFRELLVEDGNLPASYNTTRVVLLPLEPYLVTVYWDLSPEDLRKIRHLSRRYTRKAETVLRFYDVTPSMLGGKKVPHFFDVPVDPKVGNWYVHLWSAEKSFFVEFGIKTLSGRFFPIAGSNTAEVPPALPSPHDNEDYLLIKGDFDLVNRMEGKTVDTIFVSAPSHQRESGPLSIPQQSPRSPSRMTLPQVSRAMKTVRGLLRRCEEGDPCEMAEINLIFGISSKTSVAEREGDNPVG